MQNSTEQTTWIIIGVGFCSNLGLLGKKDELVLTSTTRNVPPKLGTKLKRSNPTTIYHSVFVNLIMGNGFLFVLILN